MSGTTARARSQSVGCAARLADLNSVSGSAFSDDNMIIVIATMNTVDPAKSSHTGASSPAANSTTSPVNTMPTAAHHHRHSRGPRPSERAMLRLSKPVALIISTSRPITA